MMRRRTASLCSSVTLGIGGILLSVIARGHEGLGQQALEGGGVPEDRDIGEEHLAVAVEVHLLLAEQEHAPIERGLVDPRVEDLAAPTPLAPPQLEGAHA